jgi:hypothetical protein
LFPQPDPRRSEKGGARIKLSRTAKSPERIKIQTVSKILGVTLERAIRLCETGAFASAKKNRGSHWTADKNDVLEYKRIVDKECGPDGEKDREEKKSAIGEKLAPFLGKMSDAKVARLTGVSRQTVTRHRKKAGIGAKRVLYKWKDFDALLGKVPDKEIAGRAGCSLTAVYYRRRKFNIPAYDKWEALDGLLKTMSDAEIAAKLGCDSETARKRRKLYKMSAPRIPAPPQERKSPDDESARRINADNITSEAAAAPPRYITLDTLIAMREKEGNPD